MHQNRTHTPTAADYEYDYYGYADYRGSYAAEAPFYEDFYRSYDGGGEYYYEYAPNAGGCLSNGVNGAANGVGIGAGNGNGNGGGVGVNVVNSAGVVVAGMSPASVAAAAAAAVDCGGVGVAAALQRSSRPGANAVGFVQQFV